mmetsp:Transcript_1159/g.3421  ORF Transcript_1159/g.3421 Transcript_1159/m.3421 type:complete len:1139 (+) Transcript_1159:56-3472(+)
MSVALPHINSFNQLVAETKFGGISVCTKKCAIRTTSIDFGYPVSQNTSHNRFITPRECRETRTSYSAPMSITFSCSLHGGEEEVVTTHAGAFPVMVLSNRCFCSFHAIYTQSHSLRCSLTGLNVKSLICSREEGAEIGGCFIINGLEKIIRLLQVPMRNMVLAIKRPAFCNKGAFFTRYAVMIRCARKNNSTCTITLHYLSTGAMRVRVSIRKQEFMIPLAIILKALNSGMQLGESKILKCQPESLMRNQRIIKNRSMMDFLGSMFSASFSDQFPPETESSTIGSYFLRRFMLVHVDDFACKHDILLLMARKLHCFAHQECSEDNIDAVAHQEVLLPGHLLSSYIAEKSEEALVRASNHIRRYPQAEGGSSAVKSRAKFAQYSHKMLARYGGMIGSKITSFLASGNLASPSGLDLQQTTGFIVVAERLNMWRYLSHFCAIHRGQFFTTMKTTTVRKLLPESWGFLCPVHTPDGAPCGLLSHLASKAHIVYHDGDSLPDWRPSLIDLTISLGMAPLRGALVLQGFKTKQENLFAPSVLSNFLYYAQLPICIDGIVLGCACETVCKHICVVLRCLKTKQFPRVEMDPTMEIAFFCWSRSKDVPFAGLYMFSQPARLTRPVLQGVASSRVELIGPLEQMTLHIACKRQVVDPEASCWRFVGTHMEIDPTYMLSTLASLTPFSDFNQSPRNMYQCQMGKQTMGTPSHSAPHLCDSKVYRLLLPQSPLVQAQKYCNINLDDYAQGTNSIVAVVSYTGYDMEDAMIISRSAYERGFGHGVMYKNHFVDLLNEADRRGTGRLRFAISSCPSFQDRASSSKFSDDGLPEIGIKIAPGEPLWCAVDESSNEYIFGTHTGTEVAYIHAVRIIGCGLDAEPRQASITLRYPRVPVVGDKFSSRHGQKGVLSMLWHQCDMPFTDVGISPDVIINPHAFPSRMTIGMLIESMSGKSTALGGKFCDSSSFAFNKTQRAIDLFARELTAAGYTYFGSEPVYSGVSGLLLQIEVFVGVVYYQRLRHMVTDKSQVRASGPLHHLTHQPIKGRKLHGGVRFGEMERDALLAHGATFLLHDRLLECSDRHQARLCGTCSNKNVADADDRMYTLPYVYRYLSNELAGMSVHLALALSTDMISPASNRAAPARDVSEFR